MTQRVEINCATGQVTAIPLTPAEQAAFDAGVATAATAAAGQKAADTQRTADLVALRAKAATDPAFAALLRTLSIQ